MAGTNGHGHSKATKYKQEALSQLLGTYLPKLKRQYKKKLRIIDATAGKGRVKTEQGSPLIFLDKLADLRMLCDFYAIEHNDENFDKLKNRFAGWKTKRKGFERFMDVTLVRGDNGVTTKRIFNGKVKPAGLIYVDTNWIPPFELLMSLDRANPRMRFLLSCSTTACKRHSSQAKFGLWHGRDLSDVLALFKDKKWYYNLYGDKVGKGAGSWHWSMLFGVPKNDPCASDKALEKVEFHAL